MFTCFMLFCDTVNMCYCVIVKVMVVDQDKKVGANAIWNVEKIQADKTTGKFVRQILVLGYKSFGENF